MMSGKGNVLETSLHALGLEDWKNGRMGGRASSSIRAGFLLSYQVQTHFFRNLKHATISQPNLI